MNAVGILLLGATLAQAQLAVTVSPVKVTGQKAIVPLAIENNFAEKIESARAVVFLLDEQGKARGQPVTRWVVGGDQGKPGLPAGATNMFYVVVSTPKPSSTTNLIAKVSFTRVVLEGGKLADVKASVQIQSAAK